MADCCRMSSLHTSFFNNLGFAVYSGSQVAATEWLKRVIDYVNNPEGI